MLFGQASGYVVLKRFGALAGMAAFAVATHLTMRRNSVYRRALLDAMILGILFVVISCITRVLAQAHPETGPLTMVLVVGILGTQADLITMTILCLWLHRQWPVSPIH
ncbi:MAG: hypothetical protein ACI957_002363 [Verrucomicrobiales bacterium]|jgi:hypothetical protein